MGLLGQKVGPFFKGMLDRLRAVRRPTGSVRYRPECGRSRSHQQGPLALISANLWHDWPRRRELPERLERFAQMVESQGADVVLLQEVYRTVGLRADQWLADRLAMNMLYSRANGDETAIGFEEGVALLSRYPLRVPRVHQLGGTLGFSRRVALAAEVHTPMGALLAVSTHLSFLLRENRQQWEELRAWVEEISVLDPAVIAGDFNADEGSAQMRDAGSAWIDTYRSVDPEGDGTTFEFRWPWGGVLRGCRFDYIFLRPGEGAWEVLDARVLHSGGPAHSDHRAVLATLTSEPTTEQGGRVTGAPHAGVSPP